MKIMQTKRIEKAYQVLKEYYNDKTKSISVLSKKHGVHNLGIVAKRKGLLKELEKRKPTTQDAINCLDWLIQYARENTAKRNITKKVAERSLINSMPRKPEAKKTINSNKIKKAIKKYDVRIKKLNLFWGAIKAEW